MNLQRICLAFQIDCSFDIFPVNKAIFKVICLLDPQFWLNIDLQAFLYQSMQEFMEFGCHLPN